MLEIIRKGRKIEENGKVAKFYLTTTLATEQGHKELFESVLTLTPVEGEFYGVYESGFNNISEREYFFEEVMHITEIRAKYRKFKILL